MRRIKELSGEESFDFGALRSICACSQLLNLRKAGRGRSHNWSVLLVGSEPQFVDPCGAEDPYSANLWAGLAAYIRDASADETTFPGGRDDCARELVA